MSANEQLNVFLSPKSVAVIGATERPGSWGSFIMQGLLSRPYPGRIYPVNQQAESIFGLRAYKGVEEIPESPELAIFTIPEVSVEETIRECGQKGVCGITIITAGFGEAVAEGKQREADMVRLARSYGMRLLGPNVSGTFNLHAEFNGSASPERLGIFLEINKEIVRGYTKLEKDFGIPVLIGSIYAQGESQVTHDLNEEGIRIYDRLDEIAQILSRMHRYYSRRSSQCGLKL